MENGEATLRQQIIALLRVRPWEAGGLARALGISQRQVESHLTHVRTSVEAHGERMVIGPAQCRDCGFAFAERTRTTKPSRCPQCKSEQLAPPVFAIQGRRSGASAESAAVQGVVMKWPPPYNQKSHIPSS